MTSTGRWQFDFSEPWIIVLTVLLLVSLLLVIHSVSKRLVRRAPLRALVVMVLNIVAYGVVLLFLLEPRFSQPVEQSVTLITEGTDLASIGHIVPARLYVAPGVAASTRKKQNLKSAHWLLDIGQLQLREPALNAIEVHGYGLDQDQWQNFSNDLQIDFKPPAINGFTAMRWQRSLVEGETLVVSGYYQSPDADAIIELRLLDPADNIVDEARIKNGQEFSLTTAVKARGNLEFKLQAWNSEIQLSDQVVPIESGSGARFNIMIRQSAPSFETRALKNYAASNGHRLRLDTDISKGKNLSQSANQPGDVDTSFSPTVLAEQDVLIMDGRALVNLPLTQREWLMDAVENGLGLLVLADSALLQHIGELNTNILNGFHLAPLTDAETMVNPRLLTRGASNWQEPLLVAAMQLTADDADVLIDDEHGRSQVVRRSKGRGYISISLINHSHSWLTSGQRADWGDYWSALIANLARQRGGSYLLAQAETDFYRVNQRSEVCVLTDEKNASVAIRANTPQGTQDFFELQLAPDTLNSPRQCVYFWPEAGGWQQIQLLSGDRESILDKKAIYVFQADQWLAQQRKQRVQATRTKATIRTSMPREAPAKWVSEPISPFWLWLTLVLSATLLWLERKLDIR